MNYANFNDAALTSAFVAFVTEYRVILGAGAAFGILTGILAFIFLLLQLAAKGDNPSERQKVITELAVVGISTALLGALTTVVAIFYGIMIG